MQLRPIRFIGHKIGPFEHIELSWNPESRNTIIVGENGTGKTTLVAAIAACLGGVSMNFFPPKEFERFTYSDESNAFFEFGDESQNTFACEASKNNKRIDFLQRTSEQAALGGLRKSWNDNHDVEVMAAAYGPFRDLTNKPVTGFQEITESPFNDILNPFTKNTQTATSQWIANQFMRRALAIIDDASDEADAYLDAIHRIETFFTDGLKMPLTFALERNPIRLRVEQNGSQISLDQLSDGTRSYFSWTLDYLSRASRINWKDPLQASIAPGLLLVDEIDSHLHPEWQRRIMAISAKLLPETHIIATTHSPFVVGSADDTQVFRLYRDENQKLQVEPSYDELFGYPADLILQKLFTDSLYTPKIQQDLDRLSELAGKVSIDIITPDERREHDQLIKGLAPISPWIANLLAMTDNSDSSYG